MGYDSLESIAAVLLVLRRFGLGLKFKLLLLLVPSHFAFPHLGLPVLGLGVDVGISCRGANWLNNSDLIEDVSINIPITFDDLVECFSHILVQSRRCLNEQQSVLLRKLLCCLCLNHSLLLQVTLVP